LHKEADPPAGRPPNTDGNTIFTPNQFGPGIRVEDVGYQMASLDTGVKLRGYALEAANFCSA
jgi:hypothetical protein